MVIAVEGMDGIGKTTLAKMVEKEYGFKYIQKPLSDIMINSGMSTDEIRNFYNFLYGIKSDTIKSWIIGLGNIYSILNNKESNIIVDRHFLSNYFWNGSSESEYIYYLMKEIIGVPDLTIILYGSVETRMERIRSRNPNDYDLFDEEKKAFGYDKMIEFADSFHLPYVIINTDNKTAEEVYEEVTEQIDRIKTVKKIIKRKGK